MTMNNELPLLALRGILVYPGMVIHLDVGREKSIASLERAMMTEEQEILLVSQKEIATEEPKKDEIYRIGTIAKINQMLKLPNGTIRVLVEGLRRAEIIEYTEEEKEFTVTYEELTEVTGDEYETEALMRQLLELFGQYIKVSRKITKETLATVADIDDAGRLSFMIASHLPIKPKNKQRLLEMNDVIKRLKLLLEILANEKKVLNLERKIGKRVQTSMDQTQKEYYLREQLKAIQKELGETDGSLNEVDQLREDIKDANMPEHVEEVALKELQRFERVPQSSGESSVIRNYLDWLIQLPWTEKTEDTIEITCAENILNKDHYGLDKVKERILEYLAVQKLTETIKGPILCLVGPPGVGKTSLAKSIAESINRKFVRISLGGVRDEAEIRGHRRTYIGPCQGVSCKE